MIELPQTKNKIMISGLCYTYRQMHFTSENALFLRHLSVFMRDGCMSWCHSSHSLGRAPSLLVNGWIRTDRILIYRKKCDSTRSDLWISAVFVDQRDDGTNVLFLDNVESFRAVNQHAVKHVQYACSTPLTTTVVVNPLKPTVAIRVQL